MTSVKFSAASIASFNNTDYLMLSLPDYSAKIAAKKFVGEMPDKPHIAELKRFSPKRSLDSNSYYHVLLGQLAAVLRIPTTDIYRGHIREIGDNYEIVPVRNDAVEKFTEIWKSKGLGWVVDDLGPGKIDGYRNLKIYYGSSTYDTAQMSRLIDLIVWECKEQGIEVRPQEEIDAMMKEWGK